jgi:hypothetical protein
MLARHRNARRTGSIALGAARTCWRGRASACARATPSRCCRRSSSCCAVRRADRDDIRASSWVRTGLVHRRARGRGDGARAGGRTGRAALRILEPGRAGARAAGPTAVCARCSTRGAARCTRLLRSRAGFGPSSATLLEPEALPWRDCCGTRRMGAVLRRRRCRALRGRAGHRVPPPRFGAARVGAAAAVAADPEGGRGRRPRGWEPTYLRDFGRRARDRGVSA